MKINDFYEEKIKNLTYWDIGLIKWGSMIFGVIMVKLFPQILKINVWWYVLIMMIFMIKPLYVFWFKK
jgi:hypothetical protein